MKTIIINGQRELAELPEKWYTDGTDEANEWAKNVINRDVIKSANWELIGANNYGVSFGSTILGHTYITPSEFMRLVYEPWKEAQKVELPTNYEELTDILFKGKTGITWHPHGMLPHIQACIQLTNIMTFANDAFDVDCSIWHVWSDGRVSCEIEPITNNPIFFTSKAAAEWAYKTFPEIFKAYWNV
jgi:hypothetical protein